MHHQFRLPFILFFFLSYAGFSQSDPSLGFANDMRNFARLDSIHPPEPGVILFVGSSTFTKWKDVQNYFPDYKILNRGFGGSQFSDLIYWAGKVIYPYKPKQVFIYEGDNDLGAGKTPAEITAQAKQLREMIAKNLPGVPVVIVGPKPSIARWNLKEKYLVLNKELGEYAQKTKDTKFIDVWPSMLGKDGLPLPIFEKDNLHMTADGYAIWAEILKPYLLK